MSQIVLASQNAGKLKELNKTLSPLEVKLVPQSDYTNDSIEETGLSFIENAIIKARFAAKVSGLSAIADDSGLVVPALNGQPGIYSARFAGPRASDDDNMQKLLEELQSHSKPQAYFYCVMVYIRSETDPCPLVSSGQMHGEIISEKKGLHGFGYDPIFYLEPYQCTAAELQPDIKNKISHRAKASLTLVELLKEALND